MTTTYADEAAADILDYARRRTDLLDPRDRSPALEMAADRMRRVAGAEEPKRSPSTANFRRVSEIFAEVKET